MAEKIFKKCLIIACAAGENCTLKNKYAKKLGIPFKQLYRQYISTLCFHINFYIKNTYWLFEGLAFSASVLADSSNKFEESPVNILFRPESKTKHQSNTPVQCSTRAPETLETLDQM